MIENNRKKNDHISCPFDSIFCSSVISTVSVNVSVMTGSEMNSLSFRVASSMNKYTIMAIDGHPSMSKATGINSQKAADRRQAYDLGEEAVIFLEPWTLTTEWPGFTDRA